MADVAALAGVSKATVSRVLSGAPGVSDETRARIKALVKELSYVVSPDAARLSRGSTGRVAVVMPQTTTWFYGAVLSGILSVLRPEGLDALVYQVADDGESRGFFADLPVQRQVDAVIVVAFPVSDFERRQLDLLGVPVVIAGGALPDHAHVRIDDAAAARQAVSHLIRSRARADRDDQFDGDPRAAVRAAGGPAARLPGRAGGRRPRRRSGARRRPAVEHHDGRTGHGPSAERWNARPRPSSPSATRWRWARCGACAAPGSRCPTTMSVVGIDDHPIADLWDLTTVRQPVELLGARSARVALALLGGDPVPDHHVTVPTQLVIRGTTAPRHSPVG